MQYIPKVTAQLTSHLYINHHIKIVYLDTNI
jgi:hypothetical protein